MLRSRGLELAFELGDVRSKGSVCTLENLETFLGGIELGSEIDVLLLQGEYPVLPIICKPALFVAGYLEIVDASTDPSRGGGIRLLRAASVPEFPKGGLGGISRIWAPPLR